jgi:hypothetical protein
MSFGQGRTPRGDDSRGVRVSSTGRPSSGPCRWPVEVLAGDMGHARSFSLDSEDTVRGRAALVKAL